MMQVSAAESVQLYIGMQSCQVEQACLRCREVARLHQVVLSRSTAGTFVAEACLHSIKDGPHSLLVSSVAEAQADTSEDSVRRGQLEEVAAEEVEHIPVVDGDVDSVSRVSLASAEAYLMLAKDGDAAAGAFAVATPRYTACTVPLGATVFATKERGGNGATTVAATSQIAAGVGIEVFATGGLGGVHREARESWDESADLTTMGTTPMTIVCAGVKSILDVGATLERLETLNVGVLGYGTNAFPGFYLSDSGFVVDWAVSSPDEVAAIMQARRAFGIQAALVVAYPLAEADQLDPDLHDQVLHEGLRLAAARNIVGKGVTPFLLDHFHRATHGASLIANERIIVHNADLAARIAVARSALTA